MENKLSKGGDLRIKSPQLYHPATPVKQAPSSPPLHSRTGDRSAFRSAVSAETGGKCGDPCRSGCPADDRCDAPATAPAPRMECTCAERDDGLCPACACQALNCPNVSIFRVTGPTGKPLRLCNRCTEDAQEIGAAFAESIDIERLAVQS